MYNFTIITSKMKFNFIANSVRNPILFKEINSKETIEDHYVFTINIESEIIFKVSHKQVGVRIYFEF